MRKLLALILFVMLMAFPVLTFAEEAEPIVEENIPPVEEVVTEGENEASEPTMTENIVEYVKEHFEEICVLVGGGLLAFYEGIVRKKMNGSIGTLNNNAITIANDSAKAIKDGKKAMDTGVEKMQAVADKINRFEEKIDLFLEKVEKAYAEKQSLEALLNSTKLACLEMSNEVAELLVLANIPQSKKEELYARHTQAVHELEKAEGVISNDGEKA